MIARILSNQIFTLLEYFPVIYLGGPRQAGKTTLLTALFEQLPYRSLENPDTRLLAQEDPRRFLESFPEGAILDEVQRVPEIFSYLQEYVDRNKDLRFILSGSQNFLLMQSISQSLAGRVGILNLFPFGLNELPARIQTKISPETFAWQGGYPAIYDRKTPPPIFFPNYIETYIQRDVRQLLNIGDLERFNRFIRLCAGRSGSILNYSQLARDADIAVNTAKSWISILEASYLIFLLQPYYQNFNKRIIKSPKIYFTDSGLVCHLLGIEHPDQLDSHYLYGNIIENMILAELYKMKFHNGKRPNFWFWRDNHGNEIDLLIEEGSQLYSIEIKSSRTFNTRFLSGLSYWQKLTGYSPSLSSVIYLGKEASGTQFGKLIPWKELLVPDV